MHCARSMAAVLRTVSRYDTLQYGTVLQYSLTRLRAVSTVLPLRRISIFTIGSRLPRLWRLRFKRNAYGNRSKNLGSKRSLLLRLHVDPIDPLERGDSDELPAR